MQTKHDKETEAAVQMIEEARRRKDELAQLGQVVRLVGYQVVSPLAYLAVGLDSHRQRCCHGKVVVDLVGL